MNPMVIIAILSAIQTLAKTFTDLTGKQILIKEDFATKTPEELLKEIGVDLDPLPGTGPVPIPAISIKR